ncbi:MAG: autotransporter outer membrane beta-barrel domain-containing protein [Armatimonadota bacterium]
MKHLLSIVIVILVVCTIIVSSSHAQTLPSSFNYQGRLTDTAGTPMPNGNYQMVFSIWDAATGGNQLWGSGNKTIPLNKGLFSTQIGPLLSTALPSANVFLQVQVGSDPPMPRIALGAVPFALKAAELFWPVVATVADDNPVLTLVNSGSGFAIMAVNTGNGGVGRFKIDNINNDQAALAASTNGSGDAVYSYTTGSGSAVKGYTTGTGAGVSGSANGNGTAGYFTTAGFSGLSSTLQARNYCGGSAAYFDNPSGTVDTLTAHTTGTGSAGVFDIVKLTSTSPSVWAKTTGSGPALKATPGSGLAGLFEGTIQTSGFKMLPGASNGYVLRSDADGVGSWQKFDTFTDITVSGNTKTWGLEVDSQGVNSGTLNSGGIHFGFASGEGIFSKRTSGGNQFGLDIATNHIPRISITGAGNVGIGVGVPALKLHVQGSQAGNYTTPLAYIENTNAAGNSGPALRLGSSSNSGDGVLNVSNFGTGKVAVFGGAGGEVANIDVSGNMTMSGNLSAKNLPAISYIRHATESPITWTAGETKYLETLTVKAPSSGSIVLDGEMQLGCDSRNTTVLFYMDIYDVTGGGSSLVVRSVYKLLGAGLQEHTETVSISIPAPANVSKVYRLQGTLWTGTTSGGFWHNSSQLRAQYFPATLGQ